MNSSKIFSLFSLTEKLFLDPFTLLICSGGKAHGGHGHTEHCGVITGPKNNFITAEFAVVGFLSLRILWLQAKID